MSDAAFYICVLLAFVLFAGTPDLHDAFVAWISAKGCVTP